MVGSRLSDLLPVAESECEKHDVLKVSRRQKKRKLSPRRRSPKKGNLPFGKFPFGVTGELKRAVRYHRSGQLQKAEAVHKKILKINPHYPASLYLLGVISHQVGKTDKAVDLIKKAIQNDPQNPLYFHVLGSLFQDRGNLDGAISCYQKAVALKANYAEAYSDMGMAFQRQGKLDEAISCYQKAVELKPQLAEAYYNMGAAFQHQDKSIEALSCYQAALKLRPDYAEAYNDMGAVLYAQGKLDEAISCHQKAVKLKPQLAEAYYGMGKALKHQGKSDEALSCFEKGLQIKPNHGIEVDKMLLLPIICDSNESIRQCRQNIIEESESSESRNVRLEDPYKQVSYPHFYLAYHGLNDKEINTKLASFYVHVCPDLDSTFVSYNRQGRVHDRIVLGIVSKYLCRHTIGKLNYGIIEKLSREKFHVKIFRFPGEEEDDVSKAINSAADEVVILPTELARARQQIAEHLLDILFYLDIGMESFTYFLAFSRLAPVQCVTWGHPVTTGLPNMDYFISSETAEPGGAEDHYSETLIRLRRLGVYYYRPDGPKQLPSRDRFGLPNDYNLYVCPQSLFKFHPDFDDILGALLREDPRGLLVLIEGTRRHFTKLLYERFTRAFPDVVDRVRFVPRMSKQDFLSFLMVADVLLDTIHFGGGNTSLEAFAFGLPIVTLPGQFLRGRLTLALYKQMGVMDCVANDTASYINIAVRLANDRIWKNEVSGKIRARANVLYEDIEAVHELERFFERAVDEERKRTLTSQSCKSAQDPHVLFPLNAVEMNKASYIIAYRERDGYRKRSLNFHIRHIKTHYPDVELIVVEQDAQSRIDADIIKMIDHHVYLYNPFPSESFNKAWAFNVGYRKAKHDLLIFADLDIVCPISTYQNGMRIMRKRTDIVCFDLYQCFINAGERMTEDILSGKLNPFILSMDINQLISNYDDGSFVDHHSPRFGGLNITRKSAFRLVGGCPEEFEGRGGEDTFMGFKLSMVGKCDTFNSFAVHLYHPPVIDLRLRGTMEEPNWRLFLNLSKLYNTKEKVIALGKEKLSHVGRKDKYIV